MTDLDELEAALSDFAEPEKRTGKPPREERIIAGFEEIQRFYEQHGRIPQHGEDRDIFERIYAVRLDRLRDQEDCLAILLPLDHHGILQGAAREAKVERTPSDDELLSTLEGSSSPEDIHQLRYVRTSAEIKAAEEIANRKRCEDFEKFEPLFKQVQDELKTGERQSMRFEKSTDINQGEFFILSGLLVYIADKEKPFLNDDEHWDARLRAIYSNGTESNLLMRSLQKALYKDEAGRRVLKVDVGPLFRDSFEEGDLESGTIYVLRSMSEHPFITENRNIIHKIGVTGGDLKSRIANASTDPTFLLAGVSIVATYKLAGIDRHKLETLIHRIFASAQLELALMDRFGKPVKPREWFVVPLQVINEAMDRIRDGSITKVIYDPKSASLIEDAK